MRPCEAFGAGLRRHGIRYEVTGSTRPVPCDLAVFWSARLHEVMAAQADTDGDFLVLEHGYLGNRSQWVSAGFNGLNGWAKFYEGDPRRAAYWRRAALPWDRVRPGDRRPDMIIGQVPGDESTKGRGLHAWYARVLAELRDAGRPVFFRPHPKGSRPPQGVDISDERFITRDFERCARVITFNSNSGVVAAFHGKPVHVHDPGSMAWDVATRQSVTQAPVYPNRDRWLNRLAWAQWTVHELAGGVCWDHLRQRYVA